MFNLNDAIVMYAVKIHHTNRKNPSPMCFEFGSTFGDKKKLYTKNEIQ